MSAAMDLPFRSAMVLTAGSSVMTDIEVMSTHGQDHLDRHAFEPHLLEHERAAPGPSGSPGGQWRRSRRPPCRTVTSMSIPCFLSNPLSFTTSTIMVVRDGKAAARSSPDQVLARLLAPANGRRRRRRHTARAERSLHASPLDGRRREQSIPPGLPLQLPASRIRRRIGRVSGAGRGPRSRGGRARRRPRWPPRRSTRWCRPRAMPLKPLTRDRRRRVHVDRPRRSALHRPRGSGSP